MRWVELVGGFLLMVAGLACFRGHKELDDWSFRIWTVHSDYEASTWFRSASSYVVAALLFVLGVVVFVAAVT